MIRGSCLCGEVSYEISGRPTGVVLCHCSRCRKARSAAFASNLFVADAGFAYASGADAVASFKVPDAERFTHFFCSRCGSTAARGFAPGGAALAPAGGLDGDPPLAERTHIFVGSKAPWFEITDSLPQREEAPGGSGARALEALR